MRFRFIGDPRDNYSGPEAIDMAGHKFTRDHWTEVTDAALAEKLEGHSHFDADYTDVELASDGSPIDDLPKKKGGWPKGKPRPRKVKHENPC